MNTVKTILLIVLTGSLITLIMQNTVAVNAKFLFIRVGMPVFMLLILTAATGFLLGIITMLLINRNKSTKQHKGD